jgi:hypothetical protein
MPGAIAQLKSFAMASAAVRSVWDRAMLLYA